MRGAGGLPDRRDRRGGAGPFRPLPGRGPAGRRPHRARRAAGRPVRALPPRRLAQAGERVTWHGDRHGAYGGKNACVDAAVDAYLLKGSLPEPGSLCR
ncbi:alpha/beta hydrolase [Nonomuraea sp. NPDC055795]